MTAPVSTVDTPVPWGHVRPVISALILDLGNVLVWHDNALLFQALAERSGKDPNFVARTLMGPGWLAANRGELDEEGIRSMVCSALGVEIPMEEFERLWSCHFRVHDEVLPTVERLIGQVKLVLLSNTNVLHVKFLHRMLPLLSKFDHLLMSNEVGMVKPDAAFYREALRRAGVTADKAAFFDDMQEYVDAARALGIHSEVFSDAKTFATQLRTLGLAG